MNKKEISAVVLLAASFNLAPTMAHSEPQYLKTVCLWNDTTDDVDYEIQWTGLQSQKVRLAPGSWYSHSLKLHNLEDAGVPLKIRLKPLATSDTMTAWFPLEPKATLAQQCGRLRGIPLHYEFRGDRNAAGVTLVGPTDQP